MSKIQQTLTLTTPGTYTYTVPDGVSTLEVYLWGAGGGAGEKGKTVSRQIDRRQVGTKVVGQTQVGTRQIGTQVVTQAVPEIIIPAGSQTYSSAGTFVAALPSGITTAKVTVVGGQGGGGTATVAATNSKGGSIISDRRLKTNIKLIGKYANGLNKYSWTYIWGEDSTGAMADEVEQLIPEAIGEWFGFKTVNYDLLGE